MSRLDVADVRAALERDPAAVANALGLGLRRRGSQLRGRSCPMRADHSRDDAMAMSAATGLWHCAPCGAGGDLLDAIALAHHLDVAVDFGRVLELGAALAGVRAGAAEGDHAARHAEREATERARALAERAARQAAELEAAARWERLAHHPATIGYLRGRGIDPEPAIRRGVLHSTEQGDPALPLRALDDGRVINVVTRRISLGGPKVIGMRGCGTRGTLGDAVAAISEGADVVVITEGAADTITAIATWPTCLVLGAHGAGELARIAAAAASRLREVRGWMLLVPHRDETGERAGADAARAATAAGMVLDRDLHLVDLDTHKDLADAVRAGWRWSWPT